MRHRVSERQNARSRRAPLGEIQGSQRAVVYCWVWLDWQVCAEA